MPVDVLWETPSVARLRFYDVWTLDDYLAASNMLNEGMRQHQTLVHILYDMVDTDYCPPHPLSAAVHDAENMLPNRGLMIMVKPTSYVRTLCRIVIRTFPFLARHIHFVASRAEAYAVLARHEGAETP